MKEYAEELEKGGCLSSTSRSAIKYGLVWVIYVLLGSWVFLVLEQMVSTSEEEDINWRRFKELVYIGQLVEEIHELKSYLNERCPDRFFNSSLDELFAPSPVSLENSNLSFVQNVQSPNQKTWLRETEELCRSQFSFPVEVILHPEWNFADAFHYTMSLVTTIGFGNISPTTEIGRLFCVFYGLVGIPITCLFIAKSSEVLSNKMLKLYKELKKRHMQNHPKALLYIVTWAFLALGCIVFMFLPSIAFVAIEEWSYIESFYFTFTTLATIGFGDLIAGFNVPVKHPDLYKVVTVIWIMVALSYWILLMNFLQKGIKSNTKTLKKTLKSKNISRQAELLWRFIAKAKIGVGNNELTGSALNEAIDQRLHMMALLVDSLVATSSDKRLSVSLNMSRRNSVSRNSSAKEFKTEEDPVIQIEDEGETLKEKVGLLAETKIPTVSFSELMRVQVCLKTESIPGFDNFVHLRDDAEKFGEPNRVTDEVTLPLNEVLGIVLGLASMDDDSDERRKAINMFLNADC